MREYPIFENHSQIVRVRLVKLTSSCTDLHNESENAFLPAAFVELLRAFSLSEMGFENLSKIVSKRTTPIVIRTLSLRVLP